MRCDAMRDAAMVRDASVYGACVYSSIVVTSGFCLAAAGDEAAAAAAAGLGAEIGLSALTDVLSVKNCLMELFADTGGVFLSTVFFFPLEEADGFEEDAAVDLAFTFAGDGVVAAGFAAVTFDPFSVRLFFAAGGGEIISISSTSLGRVAEAATAGGDSESKSSCRSSAAYTRLDAAFAGDPDGAAAAAAGAGESVRCFFRASGETSKSSSMSSPP